MGVERIQNPAGQARLADGGDGGGGGGGGGGSSNSCHNSSSVSAELASEVLAQLAATMPGRPEQGVRTSKQ